MKAFAGLFRIARPAFVIRCGNDTLHRCVCRLFALFGQLLDELFRRAKVGKKPLVSIMFMFCRYEFEAPTLTSRGADLPMNERMNHFIWCVALGAVCLGVWRQSANAAGDSAPPAQSTASSGERISPAPQMATTSLTALDGKIYSGASVQRVDPDGLLVSYTPLGGGMGVAKLKFRNLPESVRQQYGYDAQKAVEFERQRVLGQARASAPQSRSHVDGDRTQPEGPTRPAMTAEQAQSVPKGPSAPRTGRKGDSNGHRDAHNPTVPGNKGSVSTGGPMGGSIGTGDRGGPMGGSIGTGDRGGPMGGSIGTGSRGGPMGGSIGTGGKGGKASKGPKGGSIAPRR